jgi:hypothetical protein
MRNIDQKKAPKGAFVFLVGSRFFSVFCKFPGGVFRIFFFPNLKAFGIGCRVVFEVKTEVLFVL